MEEEQRSQLFGGGEEGSEPGIVVGDPGDVVVDAAGPYQSRTTALVEAAIGRLVRWNPQAESSLWLHCGPSICGRCYEVGPEVHEAVNPRADAPPAKRSRSDEIHQLRERVSELERERREIVQRRAALSAVIAPP